MYSIRVMLFEVGFGLRQVLFYGVMILVSIVRHTSSPHHSVALPHHNGISLLLLLVSIVRRNVPRIRLSLSAPGPPGRALCMIARGA